MRTANRFAIAIHILSLLPAAEGNDATSEWLAGSIGVNPVVVRNVIGQLRRAGILCTRQGVAGARLTRPLERITLLHVFRAVEDSGGIFSIHERPNANCPVGANIQSALERAFADAQRALESRLDGTTIADVVRDLQAQDGSPC